MDVGCCNVVVWYCGGLVLFILDRVFGNEDLGGLGLSQPGCSCNGEGSAWVGRG